MNTFSSTYQNKIADATWYVGGYSTTSVSPATWYDAESTGTTWEGKIGLMYVSDYGFAASSSAWTSDVFDYDGATIIDNNWMYMGGYEWTISRDSSSTYLAFHVNSSGYVYNDFGGVSAGDLAIRPCFYLTSNVTYVSGDGSINSPIRVN